MEAHIFRSLSIDGLRARFILWIVLLVLIVGSIATLMFYFILDGTVKSIGQNLAVQYTLKEKQRILAPIQRELALCKKLVDTDVLKKWTGNEDDVQLKSAALVELESYRRNFEDHSYFFAISESRHLYYRDSTSKDTDDPIAYTLSPDSLKDQWFYSTLASDIPFGINVGDNEVLRLTNVWFNTVITHDGKRVGIAGTGLNLKSFIQDMVDERINDMIPVLIDASGAIQAHPDKKLIDIDSITKTVAERSSIFHLIDDENQRESLRRALADLRTNPDSIAILTLNISGDKSLITAAYLEEIDWFIIVESNLSTIVNTSGFMVLPFVMIAAILLLVFAVTILINRRILQPLSKLRTASQQITTGNNIVQIETASRDEIGDLTNAFNHMLKTISDNTAALEKHREELEEKVRDRTEDLAIEVVERKKAEQDAVSANMAKSQFLANMSHEIRTPMNAILGFAEILTDQLQDQNHKQYANVIRDSGQSLLVLINDILDLSKVEAGKLKIDNLPMNPTKLLENMHTLFKQKCADKGLEFNVTTPEGFPTTILFDESRLRQILLNLLSNAIKFTRSGYVNLTADARIDETDSETQVLEFKVSDSGIGIPSDQLEKIFGAFEQQESQEQNQFGGTGLGLTITRKLVTLMNGTVNVESNLGEGSVFSVTFRNVELGLFQQVETSESTLDTTNLTFKPATVLIGEDIAVNRELIKGYLKSFNLEIIEAIDGEETVRKAQEFKPNIILMDIKMPKLSGYEATKLLKKDTTTADIPVIAVTASVMAAEEDEIRAICDGFLRKPLSRQDLLMMLCKYLEHVAPDIVGEETDSQKDEPFVLDTEAVVDIQGLRLKIDTVLKPIWERLSEALIVNEAVEFAELAIQIGNLHNCHVLARWGDQLREQAMMFDVHALEQSLKKFREFDLNCKEKE